MATSVVFNATSIEVLQTSSSQSHSAASAMTATAFLCFYSQHTQSNICTNSLISCWPVFPIHSQGVAACWPVCVTQTFLQNCTRQTSQKPLAWRASFCICMKERNPLFSMQKHACVLPDETRLVLPGPALWEPLLRPDLLCFNLPKTPNVPPFITAQKLCMGICQPASITQSETLWVWLESKKKQF